MTRLAVTLVVFTAGVTTVLFHHDRPVLSVSAPAPVPSRPVTPAASRYLWRKLLPAASTRPSVHKARHHTLIRVVPHVLRGGQQLNWHGLANCEATNNPRAVDPSGTYFGLYQFDLETWASVGGAGNPADAPPAEQTYRAELLYAERGRAPWPVCGRFL